MPLVPILARAGWRLRLHAPGLQAAEAAEALAALESPLLAGPPAVGFVLVGRRRGGLFCALHRWTAAGLEREAVLVRRGGAPPEPLAALAGGLDAEAELLLLAREAAHWRRCVLLAERPDPEAYLAAA